jgi:hypothetical protein
MERREALKDPNTAPFRESWKLEIRPGYDAMPLVSTPTAMPEDSTINGFQSKSAERSLYVGWAYESYIETESAKNRYNHMPVSRWLHSTLTLAEADPALDNAMLAISCKMSAAFHTDQALLNRSRQLYTGALGLLQRSLASSKTALKDETLAATCLLALYEVRSSGPKGNTSH